MTPPGDSVICPLGNRIALDNADGLLATLSPHFEGPRPTRIVLDMSNVRVCDSYGLRLLVNLQRKAGAAGKSLILFRPHRTIREMLEMLKLSAIFTIAESIEGTV